MTLIQAIVVLGILAVVSFTIGTLMLKHAQMKLRQNQRELVSTLQKYIVVLSAYRDLLKLIKYGKS